MMWPLLMQDDSTKDNNKSSDNWYEAWQKKSETEKTIEETTDDTSLFSEAMQGVTPLRTDNRVKIRPADKNIKIRNHECHPDIDDVFSDAPVEECPDQLLYSRDGITPATLKKLRQGKFKVDQSIDLHGMTVSSARDYLLDFLADCEAENCHCVIIVHGKGYSSPDKKPIIKPMVNRWLRATPKVLAFCSALPKDGGTGAVYVLLKRNKK